MTSLPRENSAMEVTKIFYNWGWADMTKSLPNMQKRTVAVICSLPKTKGEFTSYPFTSLWLSSKCPFQSDDSWSKCFTAASADASPKLEEVDMAVFYSPGASWWFHSWWFYMPRFGTRGIINRIGNAFQWQPCVVSFQQPKGIQVIMIGCPIWKDGQCNIGMLDWPQFYHSGCIIIAVRHVY